MKKGKKKMITLARGTNWENKMLPSRFSFKKQPLQFKAEPFFRDERRFIKLHQRYNDGLGTTLKKSQAAIVAWNSMHSCGENPSTVTSSEFIKTREKRRKTYSNLFNVWRMKNDFEFYLFAHYLMVVENSSRKYSYFQIIVWEF